MWRKADTEDIPAGSGHILKGTEYRDSRLGVWGLMNVVEHAVSMHVFLCRHALR